MSESVRILLGKRIRGLRESQGISLRAFALMIGLDKSYLIDIEYGRRNVAIDNIEKIADGLGVPLSQLFDFEKEPSQSAPEDSARSSRVYRAIRLNKTE